MNVCEFLTVSSLDKVGSSARPALLETENVMLKNETLSFQIAMACKEWDRRFCRVKVKGSIAKYVEVRYAALVPVSMPSKYDCDDYYITKDPTMLPDVLLPVTKEGFHIFYQQWRALWITVRGKGEIPVGKHKLKFAFTGEDGEKLGETSYTVTVLDGVLPSQKLLYTNWVHYDGICEYYRVKPFSAKFYALTKSFLKTAAEHGMNVVYVPLFTPPLDTAIGGERTTVQLVGVKKTAGGYEFDFSEFEKFIAMCKELGFTHFEMSHLFTQWGAKAAPKIMADVDGKQKRIFGWDTPSDGEEYVAFLTAFLPRLVAKLRELAIDKNAFLHVSDEPNAADFEHFAKASALVRSLAEDIPFIDANSNLQSYLDGISPHPIPATTEAEEFLPYHIPDMWVYYCSGQYNNYLSNRLMGMPSQRNRILGAQLYMNDIAGFLHWGYNFYESFLSKHSLNPYAHTDAGGPFQSGDSFIVYPYEKGALDSLRHEVLYDAFQDLRALELLESKIGKAAVKEFLRGEGVKEGFHEYPRDAVWHMGLRRRIYEQYFGKENV
ncbi:MAG: hypothetical protein DBX59_04845 [Bacillota bacterium]|nr:MAG: hypothetical protein DBX59_04845 [Bacillota bacterium]